MNPGRAAREKSALRRRIRGHDHPKVACRIGPAQNRIFVSMDELQKLAQTVLDVTVDEMLDKPAFRAAIAHRRRVEGRADLLLFS
jgi:hypothetical protein